MHVGGHLEEIRRIEEMVNAEILKNVEVSTKIMAKIIGNPIA